MPQALGYAVEGPQAPFDPFPFERREVGPRDVEIEIDYCGICHSDIHQVRNEWGFSTYPMVPGHEIVGRVVKAGPEVRKFKVSDRAGVGCMVDTCRECGNCRRGLEQHCLKHISFTYNGTEQDQKTPTHGGYSDRIVVDEAYALRIPRSGALEGVAPLLCAGITTYSPLRRWKAGKGTRLAVAGLGGLGHMAVKLGSAMGAEVAVLSRSKGKEADAKRLGAREFVLSSDAARMAQAAGRFDLIIDTIAAPHDVNALLALLATGGTLVLVAAPPRPLEVAAMSLIGGRKSLSSSLIGGLAETQEMLDFCAEKNIRADVEIVSIKDLAKAYERTVRGDVRYRFVIDMATLARR